MFKFPNNADINSLPALFAMIALGIIANMGFVIQPVLVGGMIDILELAPDNAGLIVTAEMTGLALASLLGAMVAHSWDRRALAYTGIILFALGNLLSGLAASFWPLLLLRALSGFGAGVMLAMYNASGAGTRVPERFFAVAIVFFLSAGALFIFFAPKVLAAGGLMAAYASLALISIPVLLTTAWLPGRFVEIKMASASVNHPIRMLAIISMLAMFILISGTSALWAYQERIGGALGLSNELISTVLGAATFGGIFGSGLAFFVGLRFGRTIIMLTALSGLLVAALLLVYSTGTTGYALAVLLIPVSWYISLPFIVGVMAWLDNSGRLVNLGSAVYALAMGAGPAVAAAVIRGDNSYMGVGWIGVVSYVACIVIYVPLTIRIDRASNTISTRIEKEMIADTGVGR